MANTKKLYKSKEKKISGVCGGIGEYFGIDPTIIRIIWAVLSLTTGMGILLYFVFAFVLEEAPDPSDPIDTVSREINRDDSDDEGPVGFDPRKM